jgi:multimeric flavodoxin WrbA
MLSLQNLEQIASSFRGQRVLLITTSNRWRGDDEVPKSTQLAHKLRDLAVDASQIDVVDAARLHIVPCEGNVSTQRGNACGLPKARLEDARKNPSGHHRCWASINNPEDELWRVSRPLIDADVILFFVSVRWGQTNSIYQKLIERLNWIENRHSTGGETNILSGKRAGIIVVGHNWNGGTVLETQKRVLSDYGFEVPDWMSGHWQWTLDSGDETQTGYRADPRDFASDFEIGEKWLVESFARWQRK